MPKCQNIMELNDVGTYLDGWGMSIATKRAKERQNQTPNVKVTTKIVKGCRLNWEGHAHGV